VKVSDHVYVWMSTITYMCESQRSRICVKVNDHVYVWTSTITNMHRTNHWNFPSIPWWLICIKTSKSESLIRFEYAVHQLFKALYRYTRLKYKTKVGKTGNSFIRDHWLSHIYVIVDFHTYTWSLTFTHIRDRWLSHIYVIVDFHAYSWSLTFRSRICVKVNDHVYVWKSTITYMCESQRSRICGKVNDHVYVWKLTITDMCDIYVIVDFPTYTWSLTFPHIRDRWLSHINVIVDFPGLVHEH
jgi:hypothetical protein